MTKFKLQGILILWALLVGSAAEAAPLMGPPGLVWGWNPQQVVAAYYKKYEFQQPETPNLKQPKILYDQRYIGDFLGIQPAHISPIFYLGRLFSMSVYFPPYEGFRASRIWERVVAALKRIYGEPSFINKPAELTTASATTTLYPIESGDDGRYQVMDLQIQTGNWTPNAEWRFDNGSFINAVIHASVSDAKGMRSIMPLVIYNKHDILHFLRPGETRWRR